MYCMEFEEIIIKFIWKINVRNIPLSFYGKINQANFGDSHLYRRLSNRLGSIENWFGKNYYLPVELNLPILLECHLSRSYRWTVTCQVDRHPEISDLDWENCHCLVLFDCTADNSNMALSLHVSVLLCFFLYVCRSRIIRQKAQ